MRIKSGVTSLIAIVILALGMSAPAGADHWRRGGWGETRNVTHYRYYPHYRHTIHSHLRPDPYAYRYEPRGYYPYYNSYYWRPAHEMRHRPKPYYVLPPYYKAWGHPKRHYRHRAWHSRHHGRIRHHHW